MILKITFIAILAAVAQGFPNAYKPPPQNVFNFLNPLAHMNNALAASTAAWKNYTQSVKEYQDQVQNAQMYGSAASESGGTTVNPIEAWMGMGMGSPAKYMDMSMAGYANFWEGMNNIYNANSEFLMNGGGAQPSAGGAQPPAGGSQPPAGGSQPPAGGSQPPAGGSQPPAGGSQPPAGGSQPPAGGSQPPAGGSQPPAGGSQPPAGGSQPPAGGSQPPAGGSQPPAGGSQPPAGGAPTP